VSKTLKERIPFLIKGLMADASSPARFFEGKRVLITGGLGFIGSNLARQLVRWNARVLLVDSLIPEYGGNLRNIHGIARQVEVNLADVRDEHVLPVLVQGQDVLFNLAGQTSHLDSVLDPTTDLEINCRAQLSILEACRHHNPAVRIVFASTRQVYGRPDYLPVDEKHPIHPVDVNGVNKRAGELYHQLYHELHGLKTSVLRLTNTIGPRMRIKDARQTFLGAWIRMLLEQKPIEVWGGSQIRDFTYVDDCVNALLLTAAEPAAVGRVFNLGGLEQISLADLAQLLIDVNGSGCKSSRRFPPERRKIDVGDYYANWSLIRETLGWVPRVSLREGLRRTLAYYRRELPHYV
jgi:UDP-glucose 4-epimerase